MRLLIVEPYFGGSHRAWAEGYARASSHDVELVTHEARFWKWRMQGAHVTLAQDARRVIDDRGPIDVVVGSSMLNLASFLGDLGPARGRAGSALYMHENQLTYPRSPRDREDETYPMINWTSMCAADRVFFNSTFHRDHWFERIGSLLKRFPDHRHSHLVDAVAAKSSVLAVGVDLARIDRSRPANLGGGPVILWNHRWEHDKGPVVFAAAMEQLIATGREFKVVLTGEQFVTEPAALRELRSSLGHRLAHVGFVGDERYVELVLAADIVVSTAEQEFFGIAITEAIYAGAFPIVPADLVFPERIPERFHDRCMYADRNGLVAHLVWAIDNVADARAIARAMRPTMAGYDWTVVAPRYDTTFEHLVTGA